MKAEQYLKRKESLSLALNGQDRLMDAAKDIEETLTKYNLDSMPETAFDVMCFTLDTIHLRKINFLVYHGTGKAATVLTGDPYVVPLEKGQAEIEP